MEKRVVIEVRGGSAQVVECPMGVEVEVRNLDSYEGLVRSTDLLAVWLEDKRKALEYACSERDGNCKCDMCNRERARLQMIEQVIAKLHELTANSALNEIERDVVDPEDI